MSSFCFFRGIDWMFGKYLADWTNERYRGFGLREKNTDPLSNFEIVDTLFSSTPGFFNDPSQNDLKIPEDVLIELRANIARRLTPQPVKVRSDIEVSNFSYSGILAIQAALAAGEALSTNDIPIKIRLVAPPLYVMVSNTTDKEGAIKLLNEAIEVIRERILQEPAGSIVVRMEPKAVSQNDDDALAALMDKVAKENNEIAGKHFSDQIISFSFRARASY